MYFRYFQKCAKLRTFVSERVNAYVKRGIERLQLTSHALRNNFRMARVAKAYPSHEDLKSNEKTLRFYTGLSSFTVLMSLFRLVSVSVPEGRAWSNKTQSF